MNSTSTYSRQVAVIMHDEIKPLKRAKQIHQFLFALMLELKLVFSFFCLSVQICEIIQIIGQYHILFQYVLRYMIMK